MAKWSYEMEFITPENLNTYDNKEQLVYNTVYELSRKSGIKMPEVGIYFSDEPNAFATGATKNSSLVAVSSGLLENMTDDEII